MTLPRHPRRWLLIGLGFVLLLSHLPLLYTALYHQLTGAPEAKNAVFSVVSNRKSDTLVLDGQWSLYWNTCLTGSTGETVAADLLQQVPGYWTHSRIGGRALPAGGTASYKLTVEGLQPSTPVTVYIPDFGSAYRAYIDGQLAAESGVVSLDPTAVHTTTGATLYPVTLSGSTHTVVLQVSTSRFGGLYMAPILKDYESALQETQTRTTFRLIIFGMALFAFFTLVVVYGISFKSGKRSFRLPAMGLLVLLRIMLTTQFYTLWQNTLFCGLSYEAANPLIFLITFAFNYLLLYLIESLLGVAFSRREKLFFLLYYVALFLAYSLIPTSFYDRYLTVLLPMAAFASEVYVFLKIWRSSQGLTKYGLGVYWGTVLAVTGMILDCYYINGNSYLNVSLALLLLFTAFMMLLSLISALRAASLHSELLLSASELQMTQDQVAMQAAYYNALSQQINQVRAARHDMRHVLGVVRRLSSEGRLEDLGRFLEDNSAQSDTEPLPIFCENVIVNAIVGYYALKARENTLPFHWAGAVPKGLSIRDSALCVVLGNALENALEASLKVHPADAFLRVDIRTAGGQLLIKIENPYKGPLRQRSGQFLTTKSGIDHGIGLRSIQKVLDGAGGYLKTAVTPTQFTLMVAFPLAPDVTKVGPLL